MPIERNLAEILGAHWDACKADMVKCLPATVLAVDTGKQTVDVQVGINNMLFDPFGNYCSVPAPSITGVPLGVLRGGGFLVSVPVAVGDYVMLHWSDRSMDTWQASTGTAVDPGNLAQHTMDSCYAIPMVAPTAKALGSVSGSNIVIGKDGADEQIVISSSDIKIGRGASQLVALGPKVDAITSALSTWLTALNTYAAAIQAVADPSNAATPALSTAIATMQAAIVSTAATLVKAQ